MMVLQSTDNIKFNKNSIVTLGTFDGVHLGHIQLINQLIEIGNNEKLRKILITIHPHPQIVLRKDNKSPIKMLNTIEERLNLLKKYDIDIIYILQFTKEVAQKTAKEFIIDSIYSKIGFKKILIGYDHSFGKNREGNKDFLKNISSQYDFEVIQNNAYTIDNTIVSSSIIRKMLNNQEIEKANEFLGYTYNITGKVVTGDNRGHTIGFPTANIIINDNDKSLPGKGIYFVSSLIDNNLIYGMANIGVRPTFSNLDELKLEVNYFGINKNLYGESLTVNFLKFIRNEKKFSSIEELITQLNADKNICKSYIDEINNK